MGPPIGGRSGVAPGMGLPPCARGKKLKPNCGLDVGRTFGSVMPGVDVSYWTLEIKVTPSGLIST